MATTTFQQAFDQFCHRASNAIMDIRTAETPRAKQAAYIALLGLISRFKRDADPLLFYMAFDMATRAQSKMLNALPKDSRDQATLTKEQQAEIARKQATADKKRLLLALIQLQGLASAVATGRNENLEYLAGKGTDSTAREKLISKIITVRSKGGRNYHYGPQTYGEILKTTGQSKVATQVTIESAKQLQTDLVQISENESLCGDFCDLYRGRVFSLSGTDPRVYPISVIPNGTCPMHVRCRHVLFPVPAGMYSDRQLRNLSMLPAAFVALGQQGADTATFQRLWVSKSPGEWLRRI